MHGKLEAASKSKTAPFKESPRAESIKAVVKILPDIVNKSIDEADISKRDFRGKSHASRQTKNDVS